VGQPFQAIRTGWEFCPKSRGLYLLSSIYNTLPDTTVLHESDMTDGCAGTLAGGKNPGEIGTDRASSRPLPLILPDSLLYPVSLQATTTGHSV